MAAMSSNVETGRSLSTAPPGGKSNGPVGMTTFPQVTGNESVHNGRSTVAMATASMSVSQSHSGYNHVGKSSRDGTVATVIERLDSTNQDKEDEEIIVDEGGCVSRNMQTGLSSLFWLTPLSSLASLLCMFGLAQPHFRVLVQGVDCVGCDRVGCGVGCDGM